MSYARAGGVIRSPRPDRHQPDLGAQNTGTPKPSHSPAVFSASGGRQSVLRENREPIRIEVVIGLVQGFLDPFP
jgi:hypothetical protein